MGSISQTKSQYLSMAVCAADGMGKPVDVKMSCLILAEHSQKQMNARLHGNWQHLPSEEHRDGSNCPVKMRRRQKLKWGKRRGIYI